MYYTKFTFALDYPFIIDPTPTELPQSSLFTIKSVLFVQLWQIIFPSTMNIYLLQSKYLSISRSAFFRLFWDHLGGKILRELRSYITFIMKNCNFFIFLCITTALKKRHRGKWVFFIISYNEVYGYPAIKFLAPFASAQQ